MRISRAMPVLYSKALRPLWLDSCQPTREERQPARRMHEDRDDPPPLVALSLGCAKIDAADHGGAASAYSGLPGYGLRSGRLNWPLEPVASPSGWHFAAPGQPIAQNRRPEPLGDGPGSRSHICQNRDGGLENLVAAWR